MNGTESRDWTKTCKMAFSRTAGGVARTSAREGAAGAAALTRRAARQGQKPATWRALGPPGPHRAKRAAAPAESGSPQRPAREPSRRVLGPAGPGAPAPSRGRTPPAPPALLPPDQPHPPSAPTGKQVRSDFVRVGDSWGSPRLPAGVSYLTDLGWLGGVSCSSAHQRSPTLPGRGRR